MAPDVENDASYRTAFGLFNDWSKATTVTAELFGDDGAVLGSKSYSLPPYSSQQNNLSDIAGTPFRHGVLRAIPADGYAG